MKNKKGLLAPLIALSIGLGFWGAIGWQLVQNGPGAPPQQAISQMFRLHEAAVKEGKNMSFAKNEQIHLETFWQPTQNVGSGEECLLGAFRIASNIKGNTKILALCPSFSHFPLDLFSGLRLYFINTQGLQTSPVYTLESYKFSYDQNTGYNVVLNDIKNFVLVGGASESVIAISGICKKTAPVVDSILSIAPGGTDALTPTGKIITNESMARVPFFVR
ncbi:MAG: hypothetical protein WC449_04290 [Candidatus Paceibacterota bacterium]